MDFHHFKTRQPGDRGGGAPVCLLDSTQERLESDNGGTAQLGVRTHPDAGKPGVPVENPAMSVRNPAVSVWNQVAIVATPTECVRATANVGHNPDMLGLRLSRKWSDTEKNVVETFLIPCGHVILSPSSHAVPAAVNFPRSNESGRTGR
jgi:hypothetical protein